MQKTPGQKGRSQIRKNSVFLAAAQSTYQRFLASARARSLCPRSKKTNSFGTVTLRPQMRTAAPTIHFQGYGQSLALDQTLTTRLQPLLLGVPSEGNQLPFAASQESFVLRVVAMQSIHAMQPD